MNTPEQNGRILQLENHLQELRRINEKLVQENSDIAKKSHKSTTSMIELVKACMEQVDNTAIAFLDSIRDYERENGRSICCDERDSEELYEIFKHKHKQ